MPHRNDEARWRWYGQVRDAIALGTGIFLLIFEAVFRERADTIIVVAALACLGIFTSGQVTRWLLGRMNGDDKR